jgi:hypothetical protein
MKSGPCTATFNDLLCYLYKPNDIILSLFAVVIHTEDNITCYYYSVLSAHELRMRIHIISLSGKVFDGLSFPLKSNAKTYISFLIIRPENGSSKGQCNYSEPSGSITYWETLE